AGQCPRMTATQMLWSGGATSSMSRATIRRALRVTTICSAAHFGDFLRTGPCRRPSAMCTSIPTLWRQVPRALGWMLNYLFTGTLFRVYRASHQYGLALTTFQLMLVWWLALAGLGGGLIAWLAIRLINGPFAFGLVIGVVATLICF